MVKQKLFRKDRGDKDAATDDTILAMVMVMVMVMAMPMVMLIMMVMVHLLHAEQILV